ncbi:hypothetical protein ACGFZK_26370 [Streptomyces sp. NPDC048257]|uniref:hypothetical protein n=1 Tax=Streptomyces sp. NPDC048257 TaxID=3365526 RepID=UPI003720691E
MPYEPAHPTTPAPLQYRDAILYPPAVREPRMLPAEIPPGVQYVTLPNGTRTLAYAHQVMPTVTPPAAQPIPRWAKTTALLAPTVGGGIAAAGFGISYAAPGVLAMAEALWAAVALIAAGTFAPLLLRTGRTAGRGRGPIHVTQNISAAGMFGRATGTTNHR